MKDYLLRFAAAAVAIALISAPAPLMAGGADIETEEVDEDLRSDEVEDDGAEEEPAGDSGY
jgi:hypothetical protein